MTAFPHRYIAVLGPHTQSMAQDRNYSGRYDVIEDRCTPEVSMLKVIGWVVGIIFLIGLLVVFGIFDLIF
jgi:hypothetical protein